MPAKRAEPETSVPDRGKEFQQYLSARLTSFRATVERLQSNSHVDITHAEATANAEALTSLMRGQVRAERMNRHGGYPGMRPAVSVDDLTAHFLGAQALAIECHDKDGSAPMLGLDADENAVTRIPIFAGILDRRGYSQKAMFATGGSNSDKGKFGMFFHLALTIEEVRRLGQAVLAEARAYPEWGIEPEGKVTVELRPTHGSGLLRIGGRHSARKGGIEGIYDPFTGARKSLADVRPHGAPWVNTAPRDPNDDAWK